jgi:hypothetical protein
MIPRMVEIWDFKFVIQKGAKESGYYLAGLGNSMILEHLVNEDLFNIRASV